jgi:Putative zinc-finger
MAGTHPGEPNLLSYVEGDLNGAEHEAVAAHVHACPDCGSRVRELERARDLLRAAPALELPAHRAALDLPPREDERRVYVSPMRFVTLLAPVAAVIAIVVALTGLPTGNDDENGASRDAGGAAETTAPAEAESGGTEDAKSPTVPSDGTTALTDARRLVTRVEGPPRRVVGVLRQRGYEVFLQDGTVVVRNAKAAEVRQALADQPRGRVNVAID